MRRDEVLTTNQRDTLKKLLVKKLTELAYLPEKKNLLGEIEIGNIGHSSTLVWVKDKILVLTHDGVVERKRVFPSSWFRRLFSDGTWEGRTLSESDFEKIVEDYELELSNLQNIINRLKKVPSV